MDLVMKSAFGVDHDSISKADGRDLLSDISLGTMLGGGAGAAGLGVNSWRHGILSERASDRRHIATLKRQGKTFKQEGARVALHNTLKTRNLKAAGVLGAVGAVGAGGLAARKIYQSKQESVAKLRVPLPRRAATSKESARRFTSAMSRAFGTPAPPPQAVHTPFYKKRSNQVLGGLTVAGVGVGGGIGYKKSREAQA
jgi:hypothetical protein